MIVVSNTSPLNYLILIEQVDVLSKLYERVLVPEVVASELCRPATPERVRDWIAEPPAWLEVRSAKSIDPDIPLAGGERDAVCLAIQAKCRVFLDDKKARRVSTERGVPVTGILGVLKLAADLGLLDFPTAVEALGQTNYRIAGEVVETALKEHAESQRKSEPRQGH